MRRSETKGFSPSRSLFFAPYYRFYSIIPLKKVNTISREGICVKRRIILRTNRRILLRIYSLTIIIFFDTNNLQKSASLPVRNNNWGEEMLQKRLSVEQGRFIVDLKKLGMSNGEVAEKFGVTEVLW